MIDLASVVATLSAAFADDPGLAWVWPDRTDRLRRLPGFFGAIAGGTVARGVALHLPDKAVSLWRQPGRIAPDQEEMAPFLADLGRAFDADSRARSMLMSETLRAHQPTDRPWWYLQFIGVGPAGQGRGAGSIVARAGLEQARAARLPVYVEVMNPANIPFYERLGFAPLDRFDIPEGGPSVLTMMWEP